ncbi:hypothetical protein [Secundilactobacillus kimchicus]|uniref:Uncharacterized protein n=1 Tax=Secundilactobacillus kimchicus JCM 15530 TaxID=1302272 RepID=A0A0R1HQB8_9LACO|nr:hypothetical protein [Secundilactobacillus kimchicus]KRK49013.1 hypothetical protein FC96_GL001336 [Secundilactobacillus kimchicus JCM 15530]MBT9671788.1 hypothetical protein [Secundilactobacillus kimchicus]
MAKPRLVLEKKSKEPKVSKLISIDVSLHDQLLDIKHETGLTVTSIVNKFIAYGVKNVEIEEAEDEEEWPCQLKYQWN